MDCDLSSFSHSATGNHTTGITSFEHVILSEALEVYLPQSSVPDKGQNKHTDPCKNTVWYIHYTMVDNYNWKYFEVYFTSVVWTIILTVIKEKEPRESVVLCWLQHEAEVKV